MMRLLAHLATPPGLRVIEQRGSADPLKLIAESSMPTRNKRSSKRCELDSETVAVGAFKPGR
jgi:hypothetical protein